MQRLGSGEGGPKIRLVWHVREPAVSFDRLVLAIQSEYLRPPGSWPHQAQQQSDCRRITRPVGSEITDDFTGATSRLGR